MVFLKGADRRPGEHNVQWVLGDLHGSEWRRLWWRGWPGRPRAPRKPTSPARAATRRSLPPRTTPAERPPLRPSPLIPAWLSVTFDALDANPVFYGSALNAASDPVRTSAPPAARDDYIGVDITPAGTPWASFAASCPGPVGGSSPACAGQSSNPEANQAVAGELAF